jgi:tetratricopeptide (TPR) repeat protein
MSVKKTLRLSNLLACISVCLYATACANPQAQAAKALEQELAARRAARTKSMRMYNHATKALNDGDTTNAKKLLNEAIQQDDDNAHAWMTLGRLEYNQGNLQQAAQAFNHASRLAPLQYEPHFNLGSVLESAGLHLRAIREYQIALQYAPDQVETMENLARCYIATKTEPDKTKQLISQALNVELRPEWIHWLKRQQLQLNQQHHEPQTPTPNHTHAKGK